MPGNVPLPSWTAGSNEISRQHSMSQQSRKWLRGLTNIKIQINLAAHEICQNLTASKPPDIDAERDKAYTYWGREEEYRSWSQTVRKHPLNDDAAVLFVTDNRSLWIWRLACQIVTRFTRADRTEQFEHQRVASSTFVSLGLQLLDLASAVKVDELDMLSEIIDAVGTQLSVLGSFGDIYHRHFSTDGRRDIFYERFNWPHELHPRIQRAVNQAEEEERARRARFTRSPLQHRQDNLLLQAMICSVGLACIYPLYRALRSAPSNPGSTSEADFWQQIINIVIQLAGFLTLLLPIYRETAAKEWIGTWILTVLGILSVIIAVPLYLVVSGPWCAFFSWLASFTQLLVVLQVSLVASFQNIEHIKQD